MSESVHDRKAAIRNTVFYVVALLLAIIGLMTRETWWGRLLMLLVILWAVGGVTCNYRAIREGFVDLDNPDNSK